MSWTRSAALGLLSAAEPVKHSTLTLCVPHREGLRCRWQALCWFQQHALSMRRHACVLFPVLDCISMCDTPSWLLHTHAALFCGLFAWLLLLAKSSASDCATTCNRTYFGYQSCLINLLGKKLCAGHDWRLFDTVDSLQSTAETDC